VGNVTDGDEAGDGFSDEEEQRLGTDPEDTLGSRTASCRILPISTEANFPWLFSSDSFAHPRARRATGGVSHRKTRQKSGIDLARPAD
jgi:hypothetical protein